MRGVLQASFLRAMSARLPKSPIRSNFDLVAGTSTGSILAAGIAFGIDPEDLLSLFKERGRDIFKTRLGWFLSGCRGPRYSAKPLRAALEERFEDATLGDSPHPLLIPATNLDRFSCRAFSSLRREDASVRVVDAVLASCAAPTFFPPASVEGRERTYVDGGLWANSPSCVAALEVSAARGVAFNQMRLLSLGNGFVPKGASAEEMSRMRMINPMTIASVLEMMFGTQAHQADIVTRSLLGSENVLAIDAPLKRPIRLDDARSAILELPALGEELAENYSARVRDFLDSDSVDARDVLIEDVMRSLVRYGVVAGGVEGGEVERAIRSGEYIRSQSFYGLLEKGLLVVKSELRFVNDHPFKPFSDLVLSHVSETATYTAVNSIPDELYCEDDIKRRLELIAKKGDDIEYYVLPRSDVHLSMLIFDESAVLVYPTPAGRQACNFSEGLFYRSREAVSQWIAVFDHIVEFARGYMREHRVDTVREFQRFVEFS